MGGYRPIYDSAMGNEDKIVQVASLDRWLGPIAITKLEAAGIEATLLEDFESTLGTGGARIEVFESDADRAREILQDLH